MRWWRYAVCTVPVLLVEFIVFVNLYNTVKYSSLSYSITGGDCNMIIAFSILSLKLVLTLASVQIVVDAKKLELLGIVTWKFNGSSRACNLFIVTVTH